SNWPHFGPRSALLKGLLQNSSMTNPVATGQGIARSKRRVPSWPERRAARSVRFGDEVANSLLGNNYEAAALEFDPAAALPVPQKLIHALARHADHLTEVALRDADRAARPGSRLRTKLKQRLRKAAWQPEKHDVLDLLARSAQPSADEFNELHCHNRIFPHHRDEIATVDDHQFTAFDRH